MNTKTCTVCKTEKSLDNFYNRKETRDGLSTECRKCRRAYLDEWRKKNPDKVKKSMNEFYIRHRERVLAEGKERRDKPENKIRATIKNKAYARKVKIEVLSHYSNGDSPYCTCCNENLIEFLTIDHINGGGSQHLKEVKAAGFTMYLWLRRNNYPDGFQVLCYNCNLSKGHHGYCPHQQISPT